MSYDFTKSDGTPVSIPDGQVTTNQFSIDLLGRNTQGYGLYVARTLVHMLENFASATAPTTPTRGQFWYDVTEPMVKVWDGVAWSSVGSGGAVNADLIPANTCAAGVGVNLGSPTNRFCTVYADTFNGTAIQARYADLAERYAADNTYVPGTVVTLGGEAEVTVASSTSKVLGVVSTNPAYLMNNLAGPNDTHPPIALVGRVPVRVIGKVERFDELVMSNIPGVAMAKYAGSTSALVGTAMGVKTTDEEGFVEIVVGK